MSKAVSLGIVLLLCSVTSIAASDYDEEERELLIHYYFECVGEHVQRYSRAGMPEQNLASQAMISCESTRLSLVIHLTRMGMEHEDASSEAHEMSSNLRNALTDEIEQGFLDTRASGDINGYVAFSDGSNLRFVDGVETLLWGVNAMGRGEDTLPAHFAAYVALRDQFLGEWVSCRRPDQPPLGASSLRICSARSEFGQEIDLGDWLVENGYAQYVEYSHHGIMVPTDDRPY